MIFEDDDDEIGGVKRRETRRGSLYEYSSHLSCTPSVDDLATTSSDTFPMRCRRPGSDRTGRTGGCGCRDASTNGRGFSSSSSAGSENRGVVFMGPNDVRVKDIPFPKLELDSTNSPVVSERQKRKCEHGGNFKSRHDEYLRERSTHGPRPNVFTRWTHGFRPRNYW